MLLSRIRRRGREFERRFDASYLEKVVTHAYNEFFFTYEDTPLLVVNTSDIDFVQQRGGLSRVAFGHWPDEKGSASVSPGQQPLTAAMARSPF